MAAAAALAEGRTSRKEKDRVEEERRMGKRGGKKRPRDGMGLSSEQA
jgi:hypothetical protein